MTKHDVAAATTKYPPRKRSYTIQAVVRAVDILNTFTSTSEILDLRVVAARAGLHKATAFRLLETLVETRLLERAGKQGYRSSIQISRSRRFASATRRRAIYFPSPRPSRTA